MFTIELRVLSRNEKLFDSKKILKERFLIENRFDP